MGARTMTEREYRKSRAGIRVMALRELRNANGIVPAGAIGTVTDKSGGFRIDFDECPTCHISLRMSKVQAADVDEWTDG